MNADKNARTTPLGRAVITRRVRHGLPRRHRQLYLGTAEFRPMQQHMPLNAASPSVSTQDPCAAWPRRGPLLPAPDGTQLSRLIPSRPIPSSPATALRRHTPAASSGEGSPLS